MRGSAHDQQRECRNVESVQWKKAALAQTLNPKHLGVGPGALASLAAIDIAREFAHILDRSQIMCYTFGAPRTGNHTFARECNVAVPETWNIMNSQ